MPITIFHKIINNNKIVIINNKKEPEKKMIRVSGDIKTKKHTITQEKSYD